MRGPGPILALALALALAGALPAAAERPLVVMGVRVDTPPFAWRDEANDSYLGFLVDLCVDAAARADYPFVQRPISAADRIDFFAGERRDLDLLCDPTTITLERLGRFASDPNPVRLEFSPIVFVANGTYAFRDAVKPAADRPPRSGRCFEIAPAAPAAAAVPADPAADPPKTAPSRYVGAAFVAGATSERVLEATVRDGLLGRASEAYAVCAVEFPSHFDAAAAFCDGAAGLRYYFGDQDILRAAIARQETQGGGACGHQFSPAMRSYEPYALVISSRTPGFRQDFVKALYEIFHHETAADRFRGNFEGRQMSPFLETLFRINKVPLGGAEP